MSNTPVHSSNHGHNKTVLVTGGAGYIGGWTILELLQQGYTVRATLRNLDRAETVRAALSKYTDATDHLSFYAADLLRDDGWAEAMGGCDYVLHIASPLSADEAAITTAREGTLRVLKAGVMAGVKRVVVTSSGVAARPPQDRRKSTYNQPINENIWTDLNEKNVDNYTKSKTLAERAAWDYIASSGGATNLVTVLPMFVLGPVLSKEFVSESVGVVSRLLSGKLPAIPRIGFIVVDVRDVVDLHLKAMTEPDAAGQRFTAGSDFLWMVDIARILREHLGSQAAKVPSRRLPDTLLRLLAPFNPTLRQLVPRLGQHPTFTSQKATKMLGWHARPVAQTIIDSANSLLQEGSV